MVSALLFSSLSLRITADTLFLKSAEVEVAFLRREWLVVVPIRPRVRSKMGSFRFRPGYRRAYLAIVDSTWREGDTAIVFWGRWAELGKRWRLRWVLRKGVLFWEFSGDSLGPVALRLRWVRQPEGEAYGLGVQCVPGPLDGRRYRLWTEEQGIGRGKQPISFVLNLAVPGAAGSLTTSYAPMATFITRARRGAALFHEGMAFFEGRKQFYGWEVWLLRPQRVEGAFWGGRDWGELLHRQAQLVGPMPLLPPWCRGAWLGLQGGWARVLPILARLRAAGVPIAALWIQDWCGQRQTWFGSELWWRWLPDTLRYPDLRRHLDSLRQLGIHTLGYVNSFLATEGPLYDTALVRGYLVKHPSGKVYSIRTPGFPAVLVDLTHPEAYQWLRKVVRDFIEAYGFSGWMTDYGEWLPWDAQLFAGSGAEQHNAYAVRWAQLSREATEGTEAVFFTRCGHTFTPRYTRLHWLGDQLTTWDEKDGLRSTLYGLLHSGLSGLPLIHSDIGGYTTIKFGPFRYTRSRELLLRWAETCVVQPVFRTHEGLRPQDNHQVYTDSATIAAFAYLAQLHVKLWEYLQACAQGYGLSDTLLPYAWAPIWRPLWMHEPTPQSKPNLAFFIGPDILFYPVTRPRQRWVEASLPSGTWYALTDSQIYEGGQIVKVPAPLGKPCLFLRVGTPIYHSLKNSP